MGRPGRRPERLTELAEAAGVQFNDPCLKLKRPALPVTTSHEMDKVLNALIRANRGLRNASRLSELFRRDPSTIWSKIKDLAPKATKALQLMFNEGCTAGEVLLLVRQGADVNASCNNRNSLVGKISGKSVSGMEGSVFQRAVELRNIELVNVLVESANQDNLDNGLNIAVLNRDADILNVLMLLGADPNACPSSIDHVIKTKDRATLSILLSGKIPLKGETATRALYDMVRLRATEVVRQLLWHGADASTHKPSALFQAIDSSCVADVAMLCLAKNFPSPEYLALGFRRISKKQENIQVRLTIVEVLLAAGASGKQVDKALLLALSEKDHAMSTILKEYCQPDRESLSQALMKSIQDSDLPLFREYLAIVENEQTIDESLLALLKAPLWYRVLAEHRTIMVADLVRQKPSKSAVAQALLSAVDLQDPGVVTLLVSKKSVEHESGQVIVNAIKLKSIKLFTMLLEAIPGPDSLTAAMKYIEGIPLDERLKWTKALLATGVNKVKIDDALQSAMKQTSRETTDTELVRMLLDKGASIDLSADGCLVEAVKAADVRTVELLHRHIPKYSKLGPALLALNNIQDLDKRYRLLELLLVTRPGSLATTKALIDVLDLIPREKRFSRLLTERGILNVNLEQGRVLVQAVKHQDVNLVQMLANKSPTQITVNAALNEAMKTERGLIRLKICQILTSAGASGTELDQALLRASVLKPCDTGLVELLVAAGASIDHKTGSALRIAIASADMALLRLLLARPAQPDTLLRALKAALVMKQKDQQLLAVELLLSTETNLSKKTLGDLLRQVTESGTDTDQKLSGLLRSKGAISFAEDPSNDYASWKTLQKTVKT